MAADNVERRVQRPRRERNMARAKDLPRSVLSDFTTERAVLHISALAVGIGFVSAFVALLLLRLIGLFTNLFFYQRIAFNLVSPAGNSLGWMVVFVPVVGALIIGYM